MGQGNLALENFNKVFDLDPKYTAAYRNHGNVYLMQGKNPLACLDAQKACALRKCKWLIAAKKEETASKQLSLLLPAC